MILVTRNQLLPQKINSFHKKLLPLNSHPSVKLFYQFATMRESYQIIRLNLYILLTKPFNKLILEQAGRQEAM